VEHTASAASDTPVSTDWLTRQIPTTSQNEGRSSKEDLRTQAGLQAKRLASLDPDAREEELERLRRFAEQRPAMQPYVKLVEDYLARFVET